MVKKYDDSQASRRQILKTGLAAAGGVIATAAAANAQDAQKIAQNMVQYQMTPKNGQMCATCVNFSPPNACKIVAGNIVATGWCIAYAPKS